MYCLCVNVYYNRVTTQLQLTNISISIQPESVYVLVALGSQHAMRMRHIVICGLPCSATLFPHYLKNGTNVENSD